MRLTPLFLAVFFSSLISIGSVEDLNIDTDPSGGLFSNDVPADNQPDSSSLALSTTYQVEDDQTANYLDGEQPLASGSSDEHTLGVLISDDCPPGSNTPTRRSKIARGSGVCNTPYSLQRSGPEGSGGTQNGGQRQNEGDQTTNGYSKPLEKEPVPQINLKLCPRGIFHDFNIPVCHDGVDKETFEDKDWTQLNNGHLLLAILGFCPGPEFLWCCETAKVLGPPQPLKHDLSQGWRVWGIRCYKQYNAKPGAWWRLK